MSLFCVLINCVDGRTQVPLAKYLKQRYEVPYVDTVTEAGAVKYLADAPQSPEAISLLRRARICFDKHDPVAIAVSAHYDCAGNQVPDAVQFVQLEKATKLLRAEYPQLEVLPLWVDENWRVVEFENISEKVDSTKK